MVSMEYEEISKNAGESTAKDENVNASTFFASETFLFGIFTQRPRNPERKKLQMTRHIGKKEGLGS